MNKKIYETTGMFIDWSQLNNLPKIDTLIDIGVYKLQDFILEMHKNDFILTMILTAKPFIADLCFQRIDKLK